jgi:hypothetical protein
MAIDHNLFKKDRRMGQEIVMVDPDNLAVKLPELIKPNKYQGELSDLNKLD